MEVSKTLGIDIGGSGIKGGVVDVLSGTLLTEKHRIPTPQPATPESIGSALRELVQVFSWHRPIGCTFPAIIDQGHARSAANVHESCLDADLASIFSEATGCELVVLNDADAAGIAEHKFGAAHNSGGLVLLLTLGTGIGSAILVDGNLIANTEFGHLEFGGGLAEHFASSRIMDEEGLEWAAFADRVSSFLAHVGQTLNPDLIILGGGVSKPSRAPLWMPLLSSDVPVVPAELGNEAGIVGAAIAAAHGIECEGRIRPF
jgi:polyphosphate glucokinase